MVMGRVERTLYRSLVRLAKTFDRVPVLKALICRNHGAAPLPEPLDTLVIRFLNGGNLGPLSYYWPSPSSQTQQQRVLDILRTSFRTPPAGPEVEGAFAGVRYLSGLLAVARKHHMLGEAGQPGLGALAAASSSAADEEEQQQQHHHHHHSSGGSGGSGSGLQLAAAPERGLVLVAHPCLGNIFSRSVVLLCRHEAHQGAYGLILNKPLGSSLKHLHERLRQLQAGDQPGGGSSSSGLRPGSSGGGGRAGWQRGGGDGGSLAAPAALEGGLLSGDIPAEKLQQVVDFLAWKQELSAAAAARPDHDEHGNWLEPSSYQEPDDDVDSDADELGAELAGADEALAGALAAVGSSSSSEGDSDAEGAPAAADIGGLLLEALRGASSDSEDEYMDFLSQDEEEEPDNGVLAALGEALRRGGGGTVIMMDPEGQVWSHHLPAGDYSQELEGGEDDGEEELEGADATADNGPAAVADLVLRSLTKQDRLMLQQQAQQQRRRQAATAAGSSSSSATSSSSGGSSSGGAASKGQQFSQQVDRLLAEASSLPGVALQQQQQQQHAPLPAAASGSNLFGIGALGGSSIGQAAAAAAAAAAVTGSGTSSSSGDDGATGNPTVSELMSLFNQSPLFRGGPVPGVQVLHRRPRLGGELVLPPWGPDAAAPSPAALAAARLAAADAAAAAEPGPPGSSPESDPDLEGFGALDGGLVVGAELARADALVAAGYLRPEDVRVMMGDCGWGPGQVEEEVKRGTWAVVRATPAFLDLFGSAALKTARMEGGGALTPAAAAATTAATTAAAMLEEAGGDYEQQMWSKCLGALGPEYAELAHVPGGVWADLADLEV